MALLLLRMPQSAGISGESGLPGPRERRMTMAYEENFQSPMVSLPIYRRLFGIGCTLSTLISGKIIDRDYRIVAQRYGLLV